MTVQIDIDHEKITAFCHKWNVVEMSLFGSVVRDDFRPDSDIDILVTFREHDVSSFSDICTMEDELAEIFGRTVDLVIRHSLEQSENYIRRQHILSELEPIHVAG